MSNTERVLRLALGSAVEGLACAVSRAGRLVLFATGPTSARALARAAAGASDAAVRAAKITVVDHRRLGRARTLDDLAELFGPGVVVFDPSRSLRRAIGLSVLAAELRRDLGRRLDAVLYNCDERRVHVVLSQDGVEDGVAAALAFESARAALTRGLARAPHGLDARFRAEVEIGWRRPVGRRVTPVDRASARRLAPGAGREWRRRAASALAVVGMAQHALPAQAATPLYPATPVGPDDSWSSRTTPTYDSQSPIVTERYTPAVAPGAPPPGWSPTWPADALTYEPAGSVSRYGVVGAGTVGTAGSAGTVVSSVSAAPPSAAAPFFRIAPIDLGGSTIPSTPDEPPTPRSGLIVDYGPDGEVVSSRYVPPPETGERIPIAELPAEQPIVQAPSTEFMTPAATAPTGAQTVQVRVFQYDEAGNIVRDEYETQVLERRVHGSTAVPALAATPATAAAPAVGQAAVPRADARTGQMIGGGAAETLGPEVSAQAQRPVAMVDWSLQKEDLVLTRGGVSVAATVQAYLQDRNAGVQLRGQIADSRDQEYFGATAEAFRRQRDGFVKGVARFDTESTIGDRVQVGVGGERFAGRTTVGGEVGFEDSEREGSQAYGVGYVGRYLSDNASVFVGVAASEAEIAPFAMAEARPWEALPWLSLYAEAGGDGDGGYAVFGVRKQFGGGRNSLIDDDRSGILPRRVPLRFDQASASPSGYEDGLDAR